MCAIAGLFGFEDAAGARVSLDRMLMTMRHRGPDDTGDFLDETAAIALGHNRLSIIDPGPGGHQPFINEDTGDVLVYNGEIYNHREIRETLAQEGMRFRTRSDTEVLLKAFEKWGPDCLRRLHGMFAFALWRPREGALYLVRDPLGIKPLYYCQDAKGNLAFASEIKALLTISNHLARVDRASLRQFIEFGYTFVEEKTIFANVKKTPSGVMLVFHLAEKARTRRYFEPRIDRASLQNPRDLEDELFEALKISVEQHLIADAPVALLLSGGLDSSLIAAFASRRAPLRTLTMAFQDSNFDERDQARSVAQHVRSEHEEILIASSELWEEINASAAMFDDIFADWGAISTRLLYKKARERGVKVALVGEGADELFGGYDTFRLSQSRLPAELWLFQLYRRYAGRRYGRVYPEFRDLMRGYLCEANGDRFEALRLFETRNQLPNNYVMKVDKASMSAGVEARVPFLDRRVTEVAYRIRSHALLSPTGGKQILRKMARRYGLLPDNCIDRPKFGAGIATNWMDENTSFRVFARDVILTPGGWTQELGLKGLMEDYFLRNLAGRRFPHAIGIFRNLAWRLLLLELWSRAMGVTASAK